MSRWGCKKNIKKNTNDKAVEYWKGKYIVVYEDTTTAIDDYQDTTTARQLKDKKQLRNSTKYINCKTTQ